MLIMIDVKVQIGDEITLSVKSSGYVFLKH